MTFLWNIGESLNHNLFRELRRCMCASCDTGINKSEVKAKIGMKRELLLCNVC